MHLFSSYLEETFKENENKLIDCFVFVNLIDEEPTNIEKTSKYLSLVINLKENYHHLK